MHHPAQALGQAREANAAYRLASGASTDPAIDTAWGLLFLDKYNKPEARRSLQEALSADPGNANYHNLYAYAIRKAANPDMNLVFKHYNEALRIDPKHRGAHEYIGEAYLMVGNVAKAKEHLATLDKICFFPCSEHADLKKAITAHEAKIK